MARREVGQYLPADVYFVQVWSKYLPHPKNSVALVDQPPSVSIYGPYTTRGVANNQRSYHDWDAESKARYAGQIQRLVTVVRAELTYYFE